MSPEKVSPAPPETRDTTNPGAEPEPSETPPGAESMPRAEDPKRGEKPRPARDEQPAFLESFPESPDLEPLVSAFVRGDYATIRKEAPRLAERTEDAAVRDAALELANRIRPDPLMRYVLAATAVFLLLLVFWTYGGHAH